MSVSTSPITRATAPGSARERAFGGTRLLALLVVVQCILRVTYLFHHSVDSDEPQHLHVIWGWTHGLVQYRDLFDNHAPLFHLLMTPVLALFDERADIVVLARLSVFPLVALSVWAIYRLGTRLWSRRVAAWAVLVAAFDPTWLLTSGEFRTDILWMAAWLCAILTLLGGPRTVGRGLSVACASGSRSRPR